MDLVHAFVFVTIGASLLVLLAGVGLAVWRSRRGRARGLASRKRTATE